jgi:hypothetical protein
MNSDNNITQLIFELQNVECDMRTSLDNSKKTFSKAKEFLQYTRKLELENNELRKKMAYYVSYYENTNTNNNK